MRRMLGAMFALFLAAGALTACGGRGEKQEAAPIATETVTTEQDAEEPAAKVAPVKVNVTGKDYDFDVPAIIRGGLVELTFNNAGREPHFARLGKIAQGKTFADVKAALTAPPSGGPPPGPPPFEEFGGFATTGPGGRTRIAFNLPAGDYVMYCMMPAPDGVPHAAKGMIDEVAVIEGTEGSLPPSVGTVIGTDFSLHPPVPTLKAGTNVVRLRNEGRQLHEINLVEFGPGRKVEDVVAWHRQPAGPPPVRYLGGVAIKPGEEAATELELKTGRTYAFICEIPDFLGDFQPHVTKGMYTHAFTVS
ncbi:MAG: hypothetical protein M3O70_04960 [Actinomycetota bacterium]|nr:hypothetical protein [Actinomycetota bacterium]